MKKSLLLIACFIIFIATNLPAQSFVQTYTLNTPEYKINSLSGKHSIKIDGYYSCNISGYPNLPVKKIRIAIHPNADMKSLQLQYTKNNISNIGQYNIPKIPALKKRGANKHSKNRAIDFYSNNIFYPADFVRLSDKSKIRKWKIVSFIYSPFQYNPVTKVLRKVDYVKVTLSYQIDSPDIRASSLIQDKVMDNRVKNMIENEEEAQKWYNMGKSSKRSNVFDYVIITTNNIVSKSSKLNSFVENLKQRGFHPRIVTENEFDHLNAQAPNGRAEKIRKWLKDHYNDFGIEYVLLIGDPDPYDPEEYYDHVGDIPMKMCYPFSLLEFYDEDTKIPTDYYYAELDGNWDLNNNELFGEYDGDKGDGGVEFGNEVYVGRISVYNEDTDTLDSILEKSIRYTNEQNTQWRKNILMPMSFSDSETDGAELAEAMINNYLKDEGYKYYRQYMKGNVCADATSKYDPEEELIEGATIKRWQSNKYGMVWWSAHGNAKEVGIGFEDDCDGGLMLVNSDTTQLNDSFPAFVFQNSCLNGKPEVPDNLQVSLLAHGAIVTYAATRSCYFRPGKWLPEFKYCCDIDSISYYSGKNVAQQKEDAGKALFNLIADLAENYNGYFGDMSGDEFQNSLHWANLLAINLLGDPSIKLIEEKPVIYLNPESNVTCHSAVLNCVIETNKVALDYFFEYGETESFGNRTKTAHLDADTGTKIIKTQIVNLRSDQQYFYRIVVEYRGNTIKSKHNSFITSQPMIQTTLPESITIPVNGKQEQTFEIKNMGCGVLTFENALRLDDRNEWLTIDKTSGTIHTQETETITLRYDAADLKQGVYNALIEIIHNADNEASPYTIPISMIVKTTGIDISPKQINVTMENDTETKATLKILNGSSRPLNWNIANIQLVDSLGKDVSRGDTYRWIDSNMENGPVYDWINIASTGQPVNGLRDDNFQGPFKIDFPFNFYGQTYQYFYISSNGFIGFGPVNWYYASYKNDQIPANRIPSNIIAWCWDDMHPRESEVFFQSSQNQAIIQFNNYGQYGSNGTITAQIILNKNGEILVQYQKIQTDFDIGSNTIGLTNKDNSDGLLVSYNKQYLQDSLALKMDRDFAVITVTPESGTINSNDAMTLNVQFFSYGLEAGEYNGSITIGLDDPNMSSIDIPLHLTIQQLITDTNKIVHSDNHFIQYHYKQDPLVSRLNPSDIQSSIVRMEKLDKTPSQSLKPFVQVTYVPEYNNRIANLKGQVMNIDPSDCQIAVYIYNEGWTNKPNQNNPATLIQENGQWSCDITTVHGDHLAQEIAVFLFHKDVSPVIMNGEKMFPKSFEKKALQKILLKR